MTHITIERAKLKLALEALKLNNDEWKSLADSGDCGRWKAEDQDHYKQTNEAIAAVEQAIAAPVAWTGCGECDCSFPCHGGRTACIRNVESECASLSMTSGERTEYEARIKRLGEALTLQYESGERLAARIMELEEATHGITKGQQ